MFIATNRFIATDRELAIMWRLCFYAMIVACNWVLECCVHYEIYSAGGYAARSALWTRF